jgi:hypothetical protein
MNNQASQTEQKVKSYIKSANQQNRKIEKSKRISIRIQDSEFMIRNITKNDRDGN